MRPSLGDLAHQLVEDGRTAVEAEINVWKAIAAWRLSGLKLGLPLLLVALFVLQALVTALFIGVVIALAPLVGAGLAVLIMGIAGLVLIGLLVWIGTRQLRTLFAPLPPEDPAA
ncbi:phage holin family protein [Sphingomonas quercus]|uniref:Phage holin family protein n=1 Tax=Sphingomonas quercus TaxID=2842451 RepID=A0ABS6BFM9_9SPHN|nr:phage holin family protein [Sphingomonas quercus]MBU3076387.1 phage holin family protein [Sphingomonas quercus]